MNYKGVIIEESLEDRSFLKRIKIIETTIEPVTHKHNTPWVSQWTMYSIEIPKELGEELAEEISKLFDKNHPRWYIDYKNDQYHFIIYDRKVFKVDLKNSVLYKDAKDYGISIGIPDYQLDFTPEDKIWER